MRGLYVGVPTVIGAKGVERVIEVELSRGEKNALNTSIESVTGLVEACKGIAPDLVGAK